MKGRTLSFAAVALLLAGVVSASDPRQISNPRGLFGPPAVISDTPDFGITGQSVLALTAFDFHPISSDVTYQYVSGGLGIPFGIYRTNASGNVWFEAGVHLPTGVLVNSAEVTFCDTAAGDFFSFITTSDKTTGSTQYTSLVSSVSATPGCVSQVALLGSPIVIDNNANSYTIEVNLGGAGTAGDNTVELGQVRLSWQYQVSPAPGSATFNDVPTSDFGFQFVEAFAAAGITVGCTSNPPFPPPVYCPDRTVTRREMAIFFAKALGLYFPN